MSFLTGMRLIALLLAALFFSSGASAAYGPVAFCTVTQEAAAGCCDKSADLPEDCWTDCCVKTEEADLSVLVQERSPIKSFLAVPVKEAFTRLAKIPLASPDTRLRSTHDPTSYLTRDQHRAELQVRLN